MNIFDELLNHNAIHILSLVFYELSYQELVLLSHTHPNLRNFIVRHILRIHAEEIVLDISYQDLTDLPDVSHLVQSLQTIHVQGNHLTSMGGV